MKYITEKVKEGWLNMAKIEDAVLVDWLNDTDSEDDRKTLERELAKRLDDNNTSG